MSLSLSLCLLLVHIVSTACAQSDSYGTAPARLKRTLVTEYRQLNSGSPPPPYPRAKDALTLPLLSINEDLADSLMLDIKEGVRYVLQTKNEWTFAIHGTGTTATHAVIDNLVEPGDRVLVGVNGYWSSLMAEMCTRLGASVLRYEKPVGSRFTVPELQLAMSYHRPQVLLLVQGESTTSVYQPLEGVGDLCQQYDALCIVDVVGVAGIQPVFMDKNKIDAVFASSHKGIGGVAGLAAISLSPRAVEKMRGRGVPPRAYQTDLLLQAELWNTSNPSRHLFQSMSIPVMYALREALATIADEGMENVYKRHVSTTKQLQRGLSKLGLEHAVPNPSHRLLAIPSYKVPQGKDANKIADYIFNNYSIDISPGFGPTEGKAIRIAVFAINADPIIVENIIRAMADALSSPQTNK